MRGMIPAQAPYEGGEPTMRKGSYSEESTLDHDRKRLNRVEDVDDEHLDGDAPDASWEEDGPDLHLRLRAELQSARAVRRRQKEMDDVHLDCDAPGAHVIVDGQTAETCGHEANKSCRSARIPSRLPHH